MPMGEQLKMSQIKKRTGWSEKTIRRAVKRGRLPATYTPGGHIRVDSDDLKKVRGR